MYKINTPSDIKKILDSISEDLIQASIHFKLERNLFNSFKDYRDEIGKAPNFWQTTISANADAVIFRLCKVFDQHKDVISLPSFLKALINDQELLQSKDFQKNFYKDLKHLDLNKIDKDYQSLLDKNNRRIKQLIIWRNNVYFHTGPKPVLNNDSHFYEDYPITVDDIENLLKKGYEIMNDYSVVFFGNRYAFGSLDEHDYFVVLDALKKFDWY